MLPKLGMGELIIILLIVAFISMFMYGGIASLIELFKNPQSQSAQTTPTDALSQINAQYQPGVDALRAAAASDPTSYTAAVNVANTYFDWAQAITKTLQGQSQPATAAMAAASERWADARSAYDTATALKADDPGVQVDRGVATFYSGDATAAITIVKQVAAVKSDFAPAWLNLGVFYEQTAQSQLAIAAFQKYIALDPKGQNVQFAQQEITKLKGTTTTKP